MALTNAELFSVGWDRALVTFTSDAGEGAVTRCGDGAIETRGPRHVVRIEGLEPDTEYALAVEGIESDAALPARFRTLVRPSGRLLATIATANDVHFGETECGHLGPPHEDIGPFFSATPGEPPYPEVMNGAVIEEMQVLDPDVVVVKGDLTERGTEEQFAAFLAAYGVFGDRLAFVRGNHDAMQDPALAVEDAPYRVDVGGVTLAVLDTVIPGRVGGHVPTDELQWLDDLAAETSGPILVFGHHDIWPIDAPVRPDDYFGLTPDSSEALVALVARHENVGGYFAGHTHGNRAYRFPSARNVPFVEVACTKDYPGAWAEYRVYEGGYTQEVHRVTAPAAFDWAEATRGMFLGLYGELARGKLDAPLLHAAVLRSPDVGALSGVRIVDMATLIAAPGAARYLADFGADVIKVEPPAGDGARTMGWRDPRDDTAFYWKQVGRNKRSVVLDLKSAAGLDTMRALVDRSDVLVENLRPGTLERLGLDPNALLASNPGLVILRVTGFGQDGPYAARPGFATMAEAMGGFAAINGAPDGPPLLPPVALTDEVSALVGAFAVMVALHHRDRTGEGQVIDVSLLESMVSVMGPLPAVWAQLGELQPRLGSGIPYSVPRSTYCCADGVWVAVSTSAETVAKRVMELVGVGDDPRFIDLSGRLAHRDELDAVMGAWIAVRPSTEVLRAFNDAQAAIAPVYTMADLLADDHVRERGTFVEVDGVTMPGPVARLARTPGSVESAGRPLGADTDAVLAEVLAESPRRAGNRTGREARPEEASE